MSEQVNMWLLSLLRRGDALPGHQEEAADLIDALHAEAEALRAQVAELLAENEALTRQKSARQSLSIQLMDEARVLRAKLEAARGLLREMGDYLSRRGAAMERLSTRAASSTWLSTPSSPPPRRRKCNARRATTLPAIRNSMNSCRARDARLSLPMAAMRR